MPHKLFCLGTVTYVMFQCVEYKCPATGFCLGTVTYVMFQHVLRISAQQVDYVCSTVMCVMESLTVRTMKMKRTAHIGSKYM